jgi:hemoglobin
MNSAATRPASMFQQIGGEEPLRKLVNTFYDIVETDPDGAPVHRLHLLGFGISHLRQAQFEFLCGFFGGPQYYVERMGHSNLRRMHEHVAIGSVEVKSWLTCMERAIDATPLDPTLKPRLMHFFTRAAEALRNRD